LRLKRPFFLHNPKFKAVITQITKKDIGRMVLYTAPFPGSEPEEGVITSYNSSYIFVKFGKQITSKACRYQNLDFAHKEEGKPAEGSGVIKTYSFNFSRLGKCGREWFDQIQVGAMVKEITVLKKVYTNCRVVAKDEDTGIVRISYE
jgi:hypothetical protein